ncbi:hypothetical protein N7462_007565 [Penicillium macrosclerotiorum]|uniref:uncharacterized protein n=1 Tax=Penicillium macrosclerotiorum TaxID=303699 RepID=UPI002547C861|nr:uncharacterized protein N7462_007565 [Penicillium macrosclerotiorum]KAJ5679321.1 hypothetical protein N7462_007565 [Penicillium macrosclerotiorum]
MKKTLSKLKRSLRPSTSAPDSAPSSSRLPTTAEVGPPEINPQSQREASPVKTPRNSSAQGHAYLENLPPEIRRYLLSSLEWEELDVLVHASPVFHQQYVLDRRMFLSQSLEDILQNVPVEASLVYQSSSLGFAKARDGGTVALLLESYQDRRTKPQPLDLTDRISLDELSAQVKFYFFVIKPLLRRYASSALDSLTEVSDIPHQHTTLSRSEKTRIVRALYRFQLCCNLFGVGNHKDFSLRRLEYETNSDLMSTFMGMFEPWEVEEIACIEAFSRYNYNRIFDDIQWDLNPENPRFADHPRPPTPPGAFELDDGWTRSTLLQGVISRGLDPLHSVLFKAKTHSQLVSTMQESLTWGGSGFLVDDAFGTGSQSKRRSEQRWSRDVKEEQRDPLPFEGDQVTDANSSHPPLAWTLIWRGTYSNLYGAYVPDPMRRWGYIMWDQSRLEETGAKEVLARQWAAEWGSHDPRDSTYYY